MLKAARSPRKVQTRKEGVFHSCLSIFTLLSVLFKR